MSIMRHRPLLWTRETLLRDLGELALGHSGPGFAVDGLVLRRDRAYPGHLFVPTPPDIPVPVGAQQESWVSRALLNGAAAALTTLPLDSFAPEMPVVRVTDLAAALLRLATLGRALFRGRIAAVTGSVGKTTTKELLAGVLAAAGGVNATAGNDNEFESIAASLASLTNEAPFAVIELCMILPGSVAPKARLVRPDIGVVTNIGAAHGAHHDDALAVYREKLGMLFHLSGSRTAVLPAELAAFDRGHENIVAAAGVGRLVTVGEGRGSEIRLAGLELRPTTSLARIDVAGTTYEVILPQAGMPLVSAALLTAGVLHALDVDMARLLPVVQNFRATSQRMHRFKLDLRDGGVLELIDDSYNASPDSMRALLEVLARRRGAKRRVLVFGDMLELKHEEAAHAELAPDILGAGIDLLVTVGPLAALAGAALAGKMDVVSFPDAKAAARAMPELVRASDLVAAKASHGTQLKLAIAALDEIAAKSRVAGRYWSIETEAAESRERAVA